MSENDAKFGVVLHLKLDLAEAGSPQIVFDSSLGEQAHFEGETRSFVKHEIAERLYSSVRARVQQAQPSRPGGLTTSCIRVFGHYGDCAGARHHSRTARSMAVAGSGYHYEVLFAIRVDL